LSYANSAMAADMFPKAYDATYELKSKYGNTQMHTVSNGKGQMRTETTQPGGMKTVSIVDMPGKMSYTIMEASKTIMKYPLKGDSGKALDETEAKRLNATNLGVKMVNGRMSQGWSYSKAPTTTEIWLDKDTNATVKSVSTTSGIKSEQNLKSLTTNVPADSYFKVPASGYKITALP
jgi:Domain of unknown function (DUF4412)